MKPAPRQILHLFNAALCRVCELPVILIVAAIVVLAAVLAWSAPPAPAGIEDTQDVSRLMVPPPPPTSPPDWPSNTTVVTNADGTYSLSEPVLSVPAPPVGREWELTFEWADNPAGTNAVAYPIRVQVPFEHDSGFVFVRARKVEVKP